MRISPSGINLQRFGLTLGNDPQADAVNRLLPEDIEPRVLVESRRDAILISDHNGPIDWASLAQDLVLKPGVQASHDSGHLFVEGKRLDYYDMKQGAWRPLA